MKRPLIAALALLAAATPALALDGIEAADRDLWCGLAIDLVVNERPDDSAIDTATLGWLVSGAERLIGRGEAAYLERGFSQATLTKRREELARDVGIELSTPAEDEPHSYEECRALFD